MSGDREAYRVPDEEGFVVVYEEALKLGCSVCRPVMVCETRALVAVIDFTCDVCGYHWQLRRGQPFWVSDLGGRF